MALSFDCTAWTGLVGASSIWMLTFLDPEELGLPTGQETLTDLRTGEGGGGRVGGVGGYWEERRKWKFL